MPQRPGPAHRVAYQSGLAQLERIEQTVQPFDRGVAEALARQADGVAQAQPRAVDRDRPDPVETLEQRVKEQRRSVGPMQEDHRRPVAALDDVNPSTANVDVPIPRGRIVEHPPVSRDDFNRMRVSGIP
jgi:hypothetical protein